MIHKILDIYKKNATNIKFAIIGLVGFTVNYSTLKVCVGGLSLNRILGEIIAAAVALQVTFVCHDKWTYRIDKMQSTYRFSMGKRYRTYLFSNSFASILTVIFFSLFSIFMGHLLALALAAVAGLVWNFMVNKKVIWHHTASEKA